MQPEHFGRHGPGSPTGCDAKRGRFHGNAAARGHGRPLLVMVRTARFALALALAAWSTLALAAAPPAQPKEGPGGSDYVASEVTKRAIGDTSGASFVFHAAGAPADPRPVVVFFLAWGGVEPHGYRGPVDPLARHGVFV